MFKAENVFSSSSLNEFIVPSQNFFNNSVKSLSDNNRFYLDNNAKSSDEMNSNVEDDPYIGLVVNDILPRDKCPSNEIIKEATLRMLTIHQREKIKELTTSGSWESFFQT
ncbi:7982_t:CDS:2, partial [Entrophospora sp. SA101]